MCPWTSLVLTRAKMSRNQHAYCQRCLLLCWKKSVYLNLYDYFWREGLGGIDVPNWRRVNVLCFQGHWNFQDLNSGSYQRPITVDSRLMCIQELYQSSLIYISPIFQGIQELRSARSNTISSKSKNSHNSQRQAKIDSFTFVQLRTLVLMLFTTFAGSAIATPPGQLVARNIGALAQRMARYSSSFRPLTNFQLTSGFLNGAVWCSYNTRTATEISISKMQRATILDQIPIELEVGNQSLSYAQCDRS